MAIHMKLPKIEERGAHHNTQIYYDPYVDYKIALESGCLSAFLPANMNWESSKIIKEKR